MPFSWPYRFALLTVIRNWWHTSFNQNTLTFPERKYIFQISMSFSPNSNVKTGISHFTIFFSLELQTTLQNILEVPIVNYDNICMFSNDPYTFKLKPENDWNWKDMQESKRKKLYLLNFERDNYQLTFICSNSTMEAL